MQRIWAVSAVLVMWMFAFDIEAAHAQTETNFHTWVGQSGLDNPSCGPIATPCRTLMWGIGKTYAGGLVECLERLDQAAFDVSKSITISCDTSKWSNTVGVGFAGPGRVRLAADDTVTIRGLRLDGGRFGSNQNAILLDAAGTLILEDVQITGWAGNGVLLVPTGPSKLVISNSSFSANGIFTNNTGAGIRVVPQGVGSARVVLDRVSVHGNVFGIAVDGTESSAGINLTVADSVSSSNAQDGIVAVSSSAPIGVLLTHVKSLNNAFGVRSIGNNVTVRVRDSDFAGNSTGISALNGGALLTGGGNSVQANGTNGSFTGSYALQ